MNVFSRPNAVFVFAVLAACSSNQIAPVAPAPTVLPTAHNALVAQLEVMRQFVVVDAGTFKCDLYTQAATAALKELVARTEAVKLERGTLLANTLTTWQFEQRDALGKIIDQVSTPLRKATTCQPVADQHAWARIAEAIVAVGEPLQIPPAIIKRRAAVENMLLQATKVKAATDCEGFQQSITTSFAALEGDLKAMPRIEQFVDNLVWEKADEQLLQGDARIEGLMKICGAEENTATP